MEYKFVNELVDKKDLTKSDSNVNSFLLENNQSRIENILEFLKSDKHLLLVNGFLGTGKNAIVKHSLSFRSPETVLIEYNCFETTVLDDILLGFFEAFRKLNAQGIINPPKTKSDNFMQKINAYFQIIERPIVIVIDSFESILKENKQEILDFIFHLSSSPKIKVILVSRKYSLEDFENAYYDRVSILALDKGIFEKYLRSEGLKQIGPLSDELYKHTRGYYFYTTLSIKIMQNKKLSLGDFLSGHSKSFLSFSDFLLREALAFVDPPSGHLFRFLTMVRHPVPINLLQAFQLYNEDRVNFFVEHMILNKIDNMIYLQDYFKDISENTITENIAVKLHRGCVELYETQLPLKPFERDLLISRQTMRKEIEYHSSFIPKRPLINRTLADIAMQEAKANAPEKPLQNISAKEEKDNQIKNMSFIFESEESGNMLNTIANSINDYIQISDQRVKDQQEIKELSLVDLMNHAKIEEQQYNFQKVITIYQRALTLENDDDYYTLLPSLLIKLANAYRNLSDWFNALKQYELAKEFYESTGDIQKICEIKWEMAHIYYVTFKRENAKQLLAEIIRTNDISNNIKVKSYLLMASLMESEQELHLIGEFYELALGILDTQVEKSVLSELYFKYALVLDEQNKPEAAIKFYKQCIDVDSSPKENPFLSSAYSNIAIIFDEIGKCELAIKYSLESLRIDEQSNNLNGIYISSMKLAELHIKKAPEKAVEYYKKAKSCALELNEPFYIASSNIALGDFYNSRKDNENALKYFVNAYNTAKNNFNKENLAKIEMRMNDIKLRVGEDVYNRLINA